MPAPEIKEGIAVLYPGTGPDKDLGRAHVCIVITNIDAGGDILLVPICTFKANSDPTCIVEAAHNIPNIGHKSYIAYYSIKKIYAANLRRHLEEGYVTYLCELDGALYATIKAGVLTSEDTEPLFERYFKAAHGLR